MVAGELIDTTERFTIDGHTAGNKVGELTNNTMLRQLVVLVKHVSGQIEGSTIGIAFNLKQYIFNQSILTCACGIKVKSTGDGVAFGVT